MFFGAACARTYPPKSLQNRQFVGLVSFVAVFLLVILRGLDRLLHIGGEQLGDVEGDLLCCLCFRSFLSFFSFFRPLPRYMPLSAELSLFNVAAIALLSPIYFGAYFSNGCCTSCCRRSIPMLTMFASSISSGAVASWWFQCSSSKARYFIFTIMEFASCNFLYRYFTFIFRCTSVIYDTHVCCAV